MKLSRLFFVIFVGFSFTAKASNLALDVNSICSTENSHFIPQIIFDNSIQNPTVLPFRLTADFAKAKKISGGGNWEGENRSFSEYGVSGTITSLNCTPHLHKVLDLNLRIRGMSSADEAKFPKLKLEFNKQQIKETSFDGIKGLRINTSGFHNDTTTPYREALAYEIAQILDLPVLRFQRAVIEYIQKSNNSKETVIKEYQALLIENNGPFLKRHHYSDVSHQIFEDENFPLDMQAAADYYLFNILIGNADIGLKTRNEPTIGTEKYRPLFNTIILKSDNKSTYFPLVYDLDKALIVKNYGKDELVESAFFERNISIFEKLYFEDLNSLRQKFTKNEIITSLNKVEKKLPQIRQLIQSRSKSGLIDKSGADFVLLLLNYYEKMSKVFFNTKITLQPTQLYREPIKSQKYEVTYYNNLEQSIPLRPSTPIKILSTTADGQFYQVAISDIRIDIPDEFATDSKFIFYVPTNIAIGDELKIKDLGYTNILDMSYF
ncbi:MAG: hypothetical protein ACK41T_12385 [Pseudobdellovibrio sp.]